MRRAVLWSLRALFAAAGIALVVYLVIRIGPARVLGHVRAAAPWLPLAVFAFGGKMLCDAIGTYAALGKVREKVPRGPVIRAQLIGSATGQLLPGGRLSEEGTKVALLARFSGAGPATAAAVINETSTLKAGALFSFPCAVAAWTLNATTLFYALLLHAAVLGAVGISVRWATRSRRGVAWFGRRFKRLRAGADDFLSTSREDRLIPLAPLAAMLGARIAEGMTYGVLAHAAGIEVTLSLAFALLGVQMIAVAVGTFFPGQIGVAELGFAVWAAELGIDPAAAIAVPLLAHLIQITYAAVGTTIPIVWPNVKAPDVGAERS